MREQAIQMAINEVQSPQFEITNQVLGVHSVVLESGIPVIARVDDTSYPDQCLIYFPLQEEDYYFVIVIEHSEGKLSVSLPYIEANVRVYLSIWSEESKPEEITSKLNLFPTEVRHKGDMNPRRSQRYEKNAWFYEPQKNIPDSLERKVIFLLDRTEPSREEIVRLKEQGTVHIHICYKGYQDWMGGWHLDSTTIKRLANIGCNVNLDLYAFGPELPD
jgi:Domain of unknown function (DUF4279)